MAKKTTGIVKLESKDRVDTKHPDYDALYEKRALYRRVLAGVDALVDNAETDLPKLPAESDDDYADRQKVATLNNYTRKAVQVMTGLVFQKPLTVDVPAKLKPICENFDKQGNNIDAFAREAFVCGFDGYAAILTDKPSAVADSYSEQQALDLNPYARIYQADSIWNWKHRINPVSQALELSLIVFQEVTEEADGRFGAKTVTRYRVYELDEAGNVILEVWIVDSESGNPVIEQEPRLLNLSAIPVRVIGKLGAVTPLYDIARKNREHCQTYSIYKSDLIKTCVPMRVIEGGSAASIPPMSGSITICPPESSGGHFGKAYFIEVAGSSLERARQSLIDIANDIALMTNSILADKNATAEMTATGEIIDNAAETSELRVMADDAKDTLEGVLAFMAEFMGLPDGGTVELNATWTSLTLTTQDITALSNLVDMGQMSLESFVYYLEKAGRLPPDVTADEELARIKGEEQEAVRTQPVLNAKRMPADVSIKQQNIDASS